MTTPLSARHWFGRVSAGLLLGFAVALGISGLAAAVIGVGDTYLSTRGQFTMWLIAPIWSLILSLAFLFPTGVRAWGWLALVAGIVWGALWLARAAA